METADGRMDAGGGKVAEEERGNERRTGDKPAKKQSKTKNETEQNETRPHDDHTTEREEEVGAKG